jgi:hypothetical protein
MLAQNVNDLLFREPCSLHLSVLVKAGLELRVEENRSGGSAWAYLREAPGAAPQTARRGFPRFRRRR